MPAASVNVTKTNTASKKKKGTSKVVQKRTDSPVPSVNPIAKPTSSHNPSEAQDYENPYLKELGKNVRNLSKKLSNVTKTEALVAARPEKSLDQLVDDKVINSDQRAQIVNKPALLAKLAEAEEVFGHFKKVQADYQERLAAEKKQIEQSLAEKHNKELEAATTEAAAKADAAAKTDLNSRLLVLSQFLAVAAARRSEEVDPEQDENRALEGCLLQVYHGNDQGVEAMLKLSGASDEKVTAVTGEPLDTTYARVKEVASAHAILMYPPVPTEPEPEPEAESAGGSTGTTAAPDSPDSAQEKPVEPQPEAEVPPVDAPETNGHAEEESGKANGTTSKPSDVAEPAGDSPTSTGMDQSWVQVQSSASTVPDLTPDVSTTTPTATNAASWSEEVEDHSAAAPEVSKDSEDGFSFPKSNKRDPASQNKSQGQGRGRGGRDGYRGRGGDGYRSRPRGNRGPRGAPRGAMGAPRPAVSSST